MLIRIKVYELICRLDGQMTQEAACLDLSKMHLCLDSR